VCRERLTAEAFGGDRLLLRIDPFAVLILRTDEDGGARGGGRDAMSRHGAVFGEHENVVAQDLEVISRVVARLVALVVAVGHLAVRLHREVAAEATRHPRRVAGEAGHLAVGVREFLVVSRNVAPRLIVGSDGLGVARQFVVVGRLGIDAVNGLLDAPPLAGFDDGVLHDLARFEVDGDFLPVLVFDFLL
jgi:hypothetical protein